MVDRKQHPITSTSIVRLSRFNIMLRLITIFILLGLMTGGCQYIVNEQLKREAMKKEVVAPTPDSKKVENGISRKYRDNGKLFNEIPMKNGKREGLAKDFYPNGVLHHEIEYKEDKKDGIAKTYYQDGVLYMESSYFENQLHGERKIFKENGEPSSVVSFRYNYPGKGLIEYMANGNEKKNYPEIAIKEVNNLAEENTFLLHVNFTQKSSKKAEYYVGQLIDGKFIHDGMYKLPLADDKQTGIFELEIPPQHEVNKEFNIVGVHYTFFGNPYVAERKYRVKVRNP